jgi:hypothetical protein
MLEDTEQIELQFDAETFMEAIKQEFIRNPHRFKNTDKLVSEDLKFLAIASHECLMLTRHWYLMRDDNLNVYYSHIFDFIDCLGRIVAYDCDELNTYINFIKL